MAWSATDDLTIFVDSGATTYYFAPTELIYSGTAAYERNTVVQEAESGQQKIQKVDGNIRKVHEWRIRKMPFADRMVDGVLIRGYSTLQTLMLSTLKLNLTSIEISVPGVTLASRVDMRFVGSTFHVPLVSKVGAVYYGDGSTSIRFREEIT